MSLQVWLPLNGDNIRNQGLANISFNNTAATVNSNGKIGQSYYFNGSAYLSENTYDWTNFNKNEFSLCCWYNEPSIASGNSQIICIGTSSGWNNIRIGLLRRTSNGYPMFSVSDGSTAIQYNFTATTFPLNEWVHIAVTYNNGKLKMYLNGQLNKEMTTTIIPALNSSQHLGIGAASNGAEKLLGYLNDVRIYDHALSDKEVKEIAKGLILHYKFDDTYIESSSTFLSSEITETAYNSVISKYGYNDTSNLIKTTGFFQGKECVKVGTRTAGTSAQPYAYFGNLFTSNGTNQPAYKALSFDYYTTVPTTTWLNIYKLGSGSGTADWRVTNSNGIKSGSYTNSANVILVKPNEWNHIEVVFHGTTDANAEWGYCINGPAHTSSPDYYFLYANIQLEQNDHCTGYGAALHNSVIYDSSGYNNNGAITGNIIINNNSGRYSNCIYISNGVNNYISSPTLTLPNNTITINYWFKSSNKTPTGDYHMPMNSYTNQAYEMSIHKTGYLRGGMLINGTRYVDSCTSTKLTDGNWHMCTMTYDGTIIKRYVDAVMEKSTSITGTLNTSQSFIFGHYGSNTSYGCKEAYVSDARIYGTALSPEDIKELYNTSMSIDNYNNTFTRELVEN